MLQNLCLCVYVSVCLCVWLGLPCNLLAASQPPSSLNPCLTPGMMKFDLPRATGPHGPAARVGRLQLAGRAALDTPNFLANTSRGAIPHVTPDLVAQHMRIGGVYLALEDCELFSTAAADRRGAVMMQPKT